MATSIGSVPFTTVLERSGITSVNGAHDDSLTLVGLDSPDFPD